MTARPPVKRHHGLVRLAHVRPAVDMQASLRALITGWYRGFPSHD